ncbi:MAG: hypothetical protein M1816_000010 [Peltula sp. TS41687]|nr:MAG: hypothetical protein M1816_000010 [Peltula sp. TS41687]
MAIIEFSAFIIALLVTLGDHFLTLTAAAPQFWNDIIPPDQPVCPVFPEPEWAKGLGNPRRFADTIFGQVVWDPEKLTKPYEIFLMIGEEEWNCMQGLQPRQGRLTGELYRALSTMTLYPDQAAKLVDEEELFNPALRKRLRPDGTITMNGYKGTLVEYGTTGDLRFDMIEMRHATPPSGPRDVASSLPFDWQALQPPDWTTTAKIGSSPMLWRVNTVGRHPSGTCTETSSRKYPIAAQYWKYWDGPAGRICK